jgi:hypothetical protein
MNPMAVTMVAMGFVVAAGALASIAVREKRLRAQRRLRTFRELVQQWWDSQRG